MTDTDAAHSRLAEAVRINTARDEVRPQWRAWRGDEDDLTRYGRGPTEQAAIDELLEMEA